MQLYEALTEQASLDEAGGLNKERAILLLWYMRSLMGVDDLEAYEFVCDGDKDGGIDGLYWEKASEDDQLDVLTIFQSKFPETPKQVGRTDLEGLVASTDKFKSVEALTTFLQGDVEPQLRALIDRFGLLERLNGADAKKPAFEVRLVFVTAGVLTGEANTYATTVNDTNGSGYLTTRDLKTLGPIAASISNPGTPPVELSIELPRADRLEAGESPRRVMIAPIRADEIVTWDGISDRSIFELNVRRELRPNRVRKQLDAAIQRETDHPDFLAFHNGLTVTCESFELEPGKVLVHGASIVNGAQSVVALHSASIRGYLTSDLQVFVKFVETAGRPTMAEQVSRRSNTQNPVNPRNLVANAPRQRSLAASFSEQFPDYVYETKPDATLKVPEGKTLIANDEAAQLVCAFYNRQPWLAVKKNSLFEPENHPRVFHENIGPAEILLAHHVATAIDAERERFPADYQKSWRLTRLVATYLVGEVLRADDDNVAYRKVLDDPPSTLSNPDELALLLRGLSRQVAATLKVHHRTQIDEHGYDDFKVHFKNESELRALRSKAQEHYLVLQSQADD